MIQHHTFTTPRTAHYSTLGNPGPEVNTWIIACHGYGQLAKRFINKFDVLEGPQTFVLAPEGLSRFYWGGDIDGKPAASWMTREDRLLEISDYANYIQLLYGKFRPLLPNARRIVLFGFSQGCATIMRYAMIHFPEVTDFVFWGANIPEDLDYEPYLSYFESKQLTAVYGTEDAFLTPERLQWMRDIIAEKKLNIKEVTYPGKHTVDREALKKLF